MYSNDSDGVALPTPGEFRPIELHFFTSQQLIDINPGVHNSETEPIGFAAL
jgi:hypothetical protein